MSPIDEMSDKYKKAAKERKDHVDAILRSQARKKTVVAGPGTGKTYLFKEALANKNRCLTLTFVNALVEDLSLELYDLSDVKTLHGFARSILGQKVKVFPKLSDVIREDAKILLGTDIDFDKIFHERDDTNAHIEFYLQRKKYYDNYYGYSSIVFAAVKYLEKFKEKIPAYDQVLVDEFQDFNKLEVSLIDLLAERSPVMLAGDDDQALYGFKGASAEHIRQRHSEANADYESFSLPYCSRCTSVIIEAVNDILSEATKRGNLQGRINKQFKYFDEEMKDKDSTRWPNILYAGVHANQISWFIEKRLGEIASELRTSFSSLVITFSKVQCHKLINALREKGFKNVESVEQRDPKEVTLLEGFRVLMADPKSNLGWRIIAQKFLRAPQFEALLKQTVADDSKALRDLIDKETRKSIKSMLSSLREVSKGNEIEEKDLGDILKKVGLSEHDVKRNALYSELTVTTQHLGNPGLRKLPIKVTTIQGSKGLSADCVFITYFDDRFFISDKNDKTKISDQDICNFLVALTRAKKQVCLVSTDVAKEATFLGWIDQSRIKRL